MAFLFCPFCGRKGLDFIPDAYPLARCEKCEAHVELRSKGKPPPAPPAGGPLFDQAAALELAGRPGASDTRKRKAVKA